MSKIGYNTYTPNLSTLVMHVPSWTIDSGFLPGDMVVDGYMKVNTIKITDPDTIIWKTDATKNYNTIGDLATVTGNNASIVGARSTAVGNNNSIVGYGCSDNGNNNVTIIGKAGLASDNNTLIIGSTSAPVGGGNVSYTGGNPSHVWKVYINGAPALIPLKL